MEDVVKAAKIIFLQAADEFLHAVHTAKLLKMHGNTPTKESVALSLKTASTERTLVFQVLQKAVSCNYKYFKSSLRTSSSRASESPKSISL